MPTVSAFFSQANRAYSTLTRQLEAVIIEVSTVQVLRLRTNPQEVHKANYLPSMKVTYSHTGFHNGQASYFSMKVLVFVEPGHMQFFLNHCKPEFYDQKYCPFSDHTYPRLAALEPCTKTKVCTPLIHTFLVAGY